MARSSFVLAVVALYGLGAASAQVTPAQKQLARFDLGVSAVGEITKGVSGNVNAPSAPNYGSIVSENASTTVGANVNIRYVVKPLVGLEFNYGYARYTENFSYQNLGAQTNVGEYTLGWLFTPGHQIYGLQPYASVGAGSTEFKPTPGGGIGLRPQARMTYYYSVGLQQQIFDSHFGARVGFRQAFFLAPDFQQNYFTIKQHTFTSEPTVGFYARF